MSQTPVAVLDTCSIGQDRLASRAFHTAPYSLYEEFIRLAETRLAQNTLNYL